ncbi:Uncharacterized conserved protein YkwD, contains CAP (CSP/antigen 5/PR1) domain [Cognatiyoonia sediminum]|uniref:Uncharacterized conserved protein YkwD, contains CAP (CSP/antigen 5/PR1) domain n=1 Tax=Cognatiyoonia sediminum TaxID=1508389 RepID=A0A1M5PM76_9RHOB|nr:CAP domain-containing protein [Cognatiyoonia sediminum]SHH02840.1 Uncharacterized conserved protein YkwD, contains CAP (CSP/antigen 5/PR1) domain [Cognatiyoonia sediminum]
MKSFIPVILLVLTAACGGTSVPTNSASFAAAPTPTASTPSRGTTGDVSFQGLLNEVRSDAGSAPVTYNAQLDVAAQRHAQDMLDNNYFSHTGLNGSSVGDRATAAGYNWRTVGENIAAGFSSESSVLQAWVDSPGHQANNINPAFEEFGLGYAANGSGNRWVLVFGAQR